MSIRLIAQDLYRFVREIEKIEKQIMNEKSFEEQERLRDRLRKVRAERNRLRNMLDGAMG